MVAVFISSSIASCSDGFASELERGCGRGSGSGAIRPGAWLTFAIFQAHGARYMRKYEWRLADQARARGGSGFLDRPVLISMKGGGRLWDSWDRTEKLE